MRLQTYARMAYNHSCLFNYEKKNFIGQMWPKEKLEKASTDILQIIFQNFCLRLILKNDKRI